MSLRCLLALTTPQEKHFAAVCVQTLNQLAMLMPAPVISYEIQEIEPYCLLSKSTTLSYTVS